MKRFRLGDILVHESLSCAIIIIAKEENYYRTRHISGFLDTCNYKLYKPQEWHIFQNIFDKE